MDQAVTDGVGQRGVADPPVPSGHRQLGHDPGRPRCSTPAQPVPMVVLAYLTDPDVVGKILRHLGLPFSAPALAPARSSGRPLGIPGLLCMHGWARMGADFMPRDRH